MQNSTERAITYIQVIIAIASLCVSAFAVVPHDSGEKKMEPYEKVQYCAKQVRDRIDVTPTVGIVLGSGLSPVAEQVQDPTVIPYSEIDGFPLSTVQGHAGNFVVGKLGSVNVIVMQGRVHYYEGYSMEDVVLPIRVMHELGAGTLIVTNAAGSLRDDMPPGTFMVINDQICNVPSPLIGKNISDLGPRFPGMGKIYDDAISIKLASKLYEQISDVPELNVDTGVYIQVTGPQYETAQEIKTYRSWGADAVGMSTCVEIITASHMGMTTAGVSCITNYGTGIGGSDPSHEEVQEMMKKMNTSLAMAIENLLYEINE